MRPSWKLTYVAAACVLAIAGCSGDGDSGTPEAADTTTASTRTTTAATSGTTTASGETVDLAVDKTGWFGGFEITVDKATATPAGAATDVDLELSYKNLVGVKAPPPDEAYLDVDGSVVDIEFEEQTIAGFGEASGTATASVKATGNKADPEKLLDNAALVYGESDANQTTIPFAEDGKVESIEPRGITVGQTIGGAVKVQLTKAFLWPSYQPGEKGKYELWVELKADCVDCPSILSYTMERGSLTLTAPNGQTLPADARSPWSYSRVSSTTNTEGEWAVFLIDAPAQGDYTLKIDFTGSNTALKVQDTTTITL
ncbi:hypothetical protein [Rhodococcus sp. NPDC058514]|uniref:hypothetical protein n=1 Tax=unclassified Rhodococcus (in: high G+C Gram-positive bacteria) TaxID=192944 RepID=UPI00365D552F